jgi:hypothetical protein
MFRLARNNKTYTTPFIECRGTVLKQGWFRIR